MNQIKGLAEYLRYLGGEEDTVLAHINPIEAEWLEEMGGSGEINPVTGLPQYGWLSSIGGALGGIFGGPVGAAAGSAAGSAIGGKKKKRRHVEEDEDDSFLSRLQAKSSDFFSDPMNLLSLGSAAASAFSRPKSERALSPEEDAALFKRGRKASRLSTSEMREWAMYNQALERAQWEARNNLAPGQTLDIPELYRRENDEEEFRKTGNWFEYFNDPQFTKRTYR